MSRRVLIGPISFSLVGGSAGICWAMIYRADPIEPVHVYLDDSALPAGCGVFLGLILGWMVSAAIRGRPLLARCTAVLAAVLLSAAMGGPMGWIIGDSLQDRRPAQGMKWGAAAGAIVGLVIGGFYWFQDRRRTPGWEQEFEE